MLFQSRGMKPQTVAANWAAKEAFSKAMGTGLRGFTLNEIAVLRDSLGAPFFKLSGRALAAAQNNNLQFSVSLSHTAELALAFVIAFDATVPYPHVQDMPSLPRADINRGTLC